jgi:hypothetical protein
VKVFPPGSSLAPEPPSGSSVRTGREAIPAGAPGKISKPVEGDLPPSEGLREFNHPSAIAANPEKKKLRATENPRSAPRNKLNGTAGGPDWAFLKPTYVAAEPPMDAPTKAPMTKETIESLYAMTGSSLLPMG